MNVIKNRRDYDTIVDSIARNLINEMFKTEVIPTLNSKKEILKINCKNAFEWVGDNLPRYIENSQYIINSKCHSSIIEFSSALLLERPIEIADTLDNLNSKARGAYHRLHEDVLEVVQEFILDKSES